MIAAGKTVLEHWKQTGQLPSRSQVTSAPTSNFDEAPPSQALLDEAKIYAEAFQMPPERAIEYLKAKKNEITWSWKDMDAKAHQKGFTVAKVMTADVLQMIRTNLEAAQKDGVPFEKFKKNLQPMLEESGWWGKQQVENPNTGKTETAQLGSAWRLETIYRTNLATARAQGRYAQQKEASALLPFWEYRQIDRDNKRDEHAKLAGKIFRADDPIWQRIFPPRGFNCGCSTQARSQKWMDRNGRVVDDSSALADWQPDDGWDFNPEEDWKPDTSKYDTDIAAEIEKVAPPEPEQAPISKPKAAKKTAAKKSTPAPAPEPIQSVPSSSSILKGGSLVGLLGGLGGPKPAPIPPTPISVPQVPKEVKPALPKAKKIQPQPKPIPKSLPQEPPPASPPSSFPSFFPSISLPGQQPTTTAPKEPIAKAPATKPPMPIEKTPSLKKSKPPSLAQNNVPRPVEYTPDEEQKFLRKHKSDYKDWSHTIKKIRGITGLEEFALYHYTTSAYEKLNKALRAGKGGEAEKIFEKMLNSALTKAPKYELEPGETLKRGLTFNNQEEVQAFLANHTEGTEIQWNSFSSCSYGENPAFNGDVVFRIRSNSGVKIDTVSKYPTEKEVLLPSKIRLKVIGKPQFFKGRWHIEAEEIP